MPKPNLKLAGATTKVDRSVAARWTKDIVAAGWTPVADYFLAHYSTMVPQITSGEAMFIIQLVSFKWDDDMPFPAFKTLAKRLGVSSTQARNLARSLERKGYLRRVIRQSTTNRFDLTPLFKAIEKHIADNPKPKAVETPAMTA